MLSLEATSQKTLQLMSNLFQKASIKTKDLPVVTKSHDDHFLRPANKQIGERECICGERCLANWMAQIRYGEYNHHQFTCVEFLLPDAYQRFLNGKGVPAQRGKCLLCTRYFQNYTYLLAQHRPLVQD